MNDIAKLLNNLHSAFPDEISEIEIADALGEYYERKIEDKRYNDKITCLYIQKEFNKTYNKIFKDIKKI
jgi:hypothetical protein